MTYTSTVTLRDPISALDLAKWVRKARPSCELKDALEIARNLIKGESWVVQDCVLAKDGPCTVLVENYVGGYPTVDYTAFFAQQEEYHKLLERAVQGDAEAALAYCRLEFDGKINHAAMG